MGLSRPHGADFILPGESEFLVSKLCRYQCPEGGWIPAKETCRCTINFDAIT
jgi:hypothetical protein